jgi:hypothetical protein
VSSVVYVSVCESPHSAFDRVKYSTQARRVQSVPIISATWRVLLPSISTSYLMTCCNMTWSVMELLAIDRNANISHPSQNGLEPPAVAFEVSTAPREASPRSPDVYFHLQHQHTTSSTIVPGVSTLTPPWTLFLITIRISSMLIFECPTTIPSLIP